MENLDRDTAASVFNSGLLGVGGDAAAHPPLRSRALSRPQRNAARPLKNGQRDSFEVLYIETRGVPGLHQRFLSSSKHLRNDGTIVWKVGETPLRL
jgi:hypothetical protein